MLILYCVYATNVYAHVVYYIQCYFDYNTRIRIRRSSKKYTLRCNKFTCKLIANDILFTAAVLYKIRN